MTNVHNDIDTYIEQYDGEQKERLKQLQSLITTSAPTAIAAMSYGMPTYKIGAKNLIHFAAFQHHIGVYPGPDTVEYFIKKYPQYQSSKGTIQFQNNESLPLDRIKELIEYRITTFSSDTFPMK